jgi:hypothetical protein
MDDELLKKQLKETIEDPDYIYSYYMDKTKNIYFKKYGDKTLQVFVQFDENNVGDVYDWEWFDKITVDVIKHWGFNIYCKEWGF